MEQNNDGEGVYIGISLRIENKDCITTDILSPKRDLENKPLYKSIFGILRIRV